MPLVPPPPGRSFLPLIGFLGAFAVILVLVVNRYLLPAAQVAIGADKTAKKHLAAISSLVLVVVLFCVFALLFIVYRPGRMFLPRKSEPRTKTRYVDAWSESAKRMSEEQNLQ